MITARGKMQTLGDFINGEMRERGMGVNEFARLVGVGHSLISKQLRPDPPLPELDFLEKLALATGHDLCAIIALIKPRAFRHDPEILLLADRVAALSSDDRKLLANYLRGLRLTSGQ